MSITLHLRVIISCTGDSFAAMIGGDPSGNLSRLCCCMSTSSVLLVLKHTNAYIHAS